MLFMITYQCCLLPILQMFGKCWTMCRNSVNYPQTEIAETRPHVLYSNLMRFQPITNSPNQNTTQHRFIVPTLSQIELANRETSRFTEIT